MADQPTGVNENNLVHSDATADAATHLLQSGILDKVLEMEGEEPEKLPETEEAVEEIEDEAESEEGKPEGEDPAEEEAEEEEEEYEEVAEPVYSVKQDGKVIQVTLDELTKGYQRQSDYTRKTQELAETRKQFTAEQQAVTEERVQYQSALNQFNQMLQEQTAEFEQIDWNELAELDPTQYLIKKEEQRELQTKQMRVNAEHQRVRQIQQQQMQRQHQELLNHEMTMLEEAFPEWKDPVKREKLANSWENYALTQGYEPDDVKAITDHRALKILDKARKYDQLQATSTKKKKLVKVPKTAKPGAATGVRTESSSRLKQKMKSLKQTGSVDAAASVFYDMDL